MSRKELEEEKRVGPLDREQFLKDLGAREVSGRVPQRGLRMWKEALWGLAECLKKPQEAVEGL